MNTSTAIYLHSSNFFRKNIPFHDSNRKRLYPNIATFSFENTFMVPLFVSLGDFANISSGTISVLDPHWSLEIKSHKSTLNQFAELLNASTNIFSVQCRLTEGSKFKGKLTFINNQREAIFVSLPKILALQLGLAIHFDFEGQSDIISFELNGQVETDANLYW